MNKVLLVSNLLRIGGAEKLLYEIVGFAKANNLQPEILILDNYDHEYYDAIYKKMDVKVIRARIHLIKNFRSPVKMLRSVFWIIKLKYFAASIYKSVHVIGMYNVDKVFSALLHPHRFFWNVNNAIQFQNRQFPYAQELFSNPNDTIVCINKHQPGEMQSQYGDALKAKMAVFKLFTAGHDTN